jgi:YD repeat-containing protein
LHIGASDKRVLGSWYLQQPNASAWVQNYVYDMAAHMTSLTSPAGTFAYTYDPAQQSKGVSPIIMILLKNPGVLE